MLFPTSEELYLHMQQELELVKGAELTEIKGLLACMPVVRKYLKLLRELIRSHPPVDQAEEVQFFKLVKPRFYQWLIYYSERYAMLMAAPLDGVKAMRRHYLEQLNYYRRSLHQWAFYYQYFKMGAVEMDYLYFIRGAQLPSVMMPEVPEVDPAYGTAMDYLFSRFLAYEALLEYLLKAGNNLSAESVRNSVPVTDDIELNWTGETINLLEVAYGWYYTRQINDGKASVIDIVRKMEQVFKVTIGRPYRRLSEIRQRKRLSRTKYIDEMGKAINKKMDDDDGLDADHK